MSTAKAASPHWSVVFAVRWCRLTPWNAPVKSSRACCHRPPQVQPTSRWTTFDRAAMALQSTALLGPSLVGNVGRLTVQMCCRELGAQVRTVRAADVRPIGLRDMEQALGMIRPSVSRKQLAAYEAWTQEYGTM